MAGDLVPYRSQKTRAETTAWIGMVIFLASWAMLFAALFFSYGMMRVRAAEWPPAGSPRLPLGLPSLNTALLLASSVALQLGLSSVRGRRAGAVGPATALAALLGAAFLVLQVVVWTRVYEAGMAPSSGPYASVFFALTWFHALHVAIGLLALLWLAVRGFRGAYSAPRHLPLRLWTMYWHFVGVVWLLMFLVIYVL